MVRIIAMLALLVSPAAAPGDETDYGRSCLAMVAFSEQNERHWEGMQLVVHVVLNRLNDSKARFGDNICSVAEQRGQFEGLTNWPRPRDPDRRNRERWRMAQLAAKRGIDGDIAVPGPCLSDKPILFFHSGDRPYWARYLHFTCMVDGHFFYSER